MALVATHLRFALDIHHDLGVRDLNAFLSGTLYPDSRYITGINKFTTHPRDYAEDPKFRKDDFHKGWFAHLLCDDIQYGRMNDAFSAICKLDGNMGNPDAEAWFNRNALKILQDIDDARHFDVGSVLSSLSHIETPNEEDGEKIRAYMRIFPALYADYQNLTTAHGYELWKQFGVGEERAGKIKMRADEYAADPIVAAGIPQLYPAMLIEVRKILGGV